MRKAVVYYVTDAPEWERLMDDLTCLCTDVQWEKLLRMIKEADTFLAESEIGNLLQKEALLAKEEKRKDRSPSPFDDQKVRLEKLAVIRDDFVSRGIVFRDIRT